MASKKQTQEALLEAAFARFIELIEPIEGVVYVAAIEPRRPDIFTYIREENDEVMDRVFDAETAVMDEFPEMLIDFHTVFVDNRSFEYFWSQTPELSFERAKSLKKKAKRGV